MFRQHCNGSAKSTAYLDPSGKLSKNKYCIINSEREAKHFKKLPQNKVSDLDFSLFSTYSTKHPLSIYPFRYVGIIPAGSYASSDWWLPSRIQIFLLDCFSLALVQSYLNSRELEPSKNDQTPAISPRLHLMLYGRTHKSLWAKSSVLETFEIVYSDICTLWSYISHGDWTWLTDTTWRETFVL